MVLRCWVESLAEGDSLLDEGGAALRKLVSRIHRTCWPQLEIDSDRKRSLLFICSLALLCGVFLSKSVAGGPQTWFVDVLPQFKSAIEPYDSPLERELPPPRFSPRPQRVPSAEALRDAKILLEAGLSQAKSQGLHLDSIGFHVELPGGAVLAHRSNEPMIPASTLKLLTTAAALDLLGENHLFKTELWSQGEGREGILYGDLIVVGGGDPAISGRAYREDPVAELRPWARLLRELGISRVKGRLIADDRYLAGPSRLDAWPQDQRHRWYCAPSGAINLNDNCVDVVISSVDSGVSAKIRPASQLFTVDQKIVPTVEEKKHLYSVDRSVGSWDIRLRGKFLNRVQERTEWVTVPDPSLAFLGAWREVLREEGIRVEGELRRDVLPEGAIHLATIHHPLHDTLPILLKRSQNLYGDCLFRVSDRESGGDGSYRSASQTALSYLALYLRGQRSGSEILDGSGLARSNRLRPSDLVRVLHRADDAEWGAIFWAALPIAGVDGTLSRRFRQTELSGRLLAKTGHLAGVSGLCGGWESRLGPVRFAALTGGSGARVGTFKKWLDLWLVDLDRSLGGAPPSSGSTRETGKTGDL